jgi:predicted MFS family arabinose efflux permease
MSPGPIPLVVAEDPYRSGRSFFSRTVYFLLIGWWLGAFWLWMALVLISTLIGLPLGLWMLNRLPQVLTLKESGRRSSQHWHTGRSFRHDHPVLFALIVLVVLLFVLAIIAV